MDALKRFNQALQARRNLHRDFVATFSTPEGQRVLKHICKIGYLKDTTFNFVSRDKTLLNEGSRLLALAILKHLHKQPEEAVAEAIIGD
jgi:hypothetical protein